MQNNFAIPSVPLSTVSRLLKKRKHESISVFSMMKLATPIVATEDNGTFMVSKFMIKKNEQYWTQPEPMRIVIELEPFAKGSFRECFMATNDLNERIVVKKFLQQSIETIKDVSSTSSVETEDTFARRTIQGHMLAKHFTECFKSHLNEKCDDRNFGEVFNYNVAKLGIRVDKDKKQEIVMIENFLSGTFTKYLNNDGCVMKMDKNELVLKAECLTHYTYQKSDGKMLLTDIQGCGFNLTDDDKFQFSIGNMAFEAVTNFKSAHNCNQYCEMAKLKPLLK